MAESRNQKRLRLTEALKKFPNNNAKLAYDAMIQGKDPQQYIEDKKKEFIRRNFGTLQCEDCGVNISANKNAYCKRCSDRRFNLVQPYNLGDIK